MTETVAEALADRPLSDHEVEPYARIRQTGRRSWEIMIVTHEFPSGGLMCYPVTNRARSSARAEEIAQKFIDREKRDRTCPRCNRRAHDTSKSGLPAGEKDLRDLRCEERYHRQAAERLYAIAGILGAIAVVILVVATVLGMVIA